EQLLKFSVLHPHVIGNLAVVQNVPLHTRTGAVNETAAREKIAEIVGTDIGRERANIADQSKSWKQVGLGDANLRGLLSRLEFRAPDIGPTAEQICGNADNHLFGTGGNIVGA